MEKAEIENYTQALKNLKPYMSLGLNVYGIKPMPNSLDIPLTETKSIVIGLVFAEIVVKRRTWLRDIREIRPTLHGQYHVSSRNEISGYDKETINEKVVEALDEGCSLAFTLLHRGEERFGAVPKEMSVMMIMTNKKLLRSLEEFGSGYGVILDAIDKRRLERHLREGSGYYLRRDEKTIQPAIWN